MNYGFIREYRSEHSLVVMCRVLGVSRSGYYAWIGRTPGPRARANADLFQCQAGDSFAEL